MAIERAQQIPIEDITELVHLAGGETAGPMADEIDQINCYAGLVVGVASIQDEQWQSTGYWKITLDSGLIITSSSYRAQNCLLDDRVRFFELPEDADCYTEYEKTNHVGISITRHGTYVDIMHVAREQIILPQPQTADENTRTSPD